VACGDEFEIFLTDTQGHWMFEISKGGKFMTGSQRYCDKRRLANSIADTVLVNSDFCGQVKNRLML